MGKTVTVVWRMVSDCVGAIVEERPIFLYSQLITLRVAKNPDHLEGNDA
jgi:hypothetical protein